MKTVYLPSGPRATGKSTLSTLVMRKYPNVKILSIDVIHVIVAKEYNLDKTIYAQNQEIMSRSEALILAMARKLLSEDGAQIIFDSFAVFPESRKTIIRFMREYGADKVICWQLTTPIKISRSLYRVRQEIDKQAEEEQERLLREYDRDYAWYYEHAQAIATEGFDAIYKVDIGEAISLSEIMRSTSD